MPTKRFKVRLVGICRCTSDVVVTAPTKKEAEKKAVRAARKSGRWDYDGQVTGVNVKRDRRGLGNNKRNTASKKT